MPRKWCRGYSLIELLIAMSISALVVVGVGLVLQSQDRAYQAQEAGMEDRRTLGPAVEQLQQDLWMAGSGLPPGTLPAISPRHGDEGPLITIRYLTNAPFATTLTAEASEDSTVFRIPPDAIRHFRRGDQVIIRRDRAWLAFPVAAVESGNRPGLRPDQGVLRSPGDVLGRLSFPQGSAVIRLRDAEVRYLLERGDQGHLRLSRRRGERETVVAVGLQELRLEYLVGQAANGHPTIALWTPKPPGNTPILGARVTLTVGRTSVRFTVTPRNLFPEPPS